MSRAVFIRAWPRDSASAATVAVCLAGGGSDRPYYHDGQHYRAGVASDPRFTAALGFDKNGWSGGVVPSISAIAFRPAESSLLDQLGALFWTDASIEIDVVEGSGPARRRLTGAVAKVAEQESALSIGVADLSQALAKPLATGTFAGTGGIEGDAVAEGRVKRRSYGRVFNAEGRLLLAAYNIYEYGDPARPLHGCTALRDKGRAGALVILGWQGSIAATLDALKAATVPEGGGVFAPSIACAKWWTQPAGPLTADLLGEVGAGYVETVAEIAARISADLSGPAVDDLASAIALQPAAAGWHIGDATKSGAAVLDDMLAGAGLKWVLRPDGLISISQWTWDAPVESLTGTYVGRDAQYAPHKSRKLGYRKNERKHGDGEIAADILAADIITNDGSSLEDAIDEAGKTADWDQVSGDGKPEDNATNGANAAEKEQINKIADVERAITDLQGAFGDTQSAAESAAAAALDRVKASEFAQAAQASVKAIAIAGMPERYVSADDEGFTSRNSHGSPSAAATAPANATSADGLIVYNVLATSIGTGAWGPKATVPAVPGRIYEVEVEYEVISDAGGGNAQIICWAMNASYEANGSGGWNAPPYASSGIQTATRMFSDVAGAGINAWSATPDGAQHLRFMGRVWPNSNTRVEWRRITIRDVTAREAAKKQADLSLGHAEASAGSVSLANAKADEASVSADAARADKLAAEAAMGQSQSSASASAASAVAASDSQSSAYQSAMLSASFSGNTLNPNPILAQWPDAAGLPSYYLAWAVALPLTRDVGQAPNPYAMRVDLPSSTEPGGGGYHLIAPTAQKTVQAGMWVVLEVDAERISGDVRGAGVLFQVLNSSNNSVSDAARVSLSSDADVAGVTGQGGTGIRRWRKLVRLTEDSAAHTYRIYAMSRWSGMPGYIAAATANSIRWHRIAFRPATDAEIAAKKVAEDLVATNAAITDEATARANAVAAVARTVQEVKVTADDASAAVTETKDAVVDINGKAAAMMGVRVAANGLVSGYRSWAGDSQAGFAVDADYFSVGSWGFAAKPFVVANGVTYIKKASIKDADIDTLKIAGNAVTVPQGVSSDTLLTIQSEWVLAAEINANTMSAPTLLQAHIRYSQVSGGWSYFRYRLLANGYVIYEPANALSGYGSSSAELLATFAFLHSGAGENTVYRLEIRATGTALDVRQRSLIITSMRR